MKRKTLVAAMGAMAFILTACSSGGEAQTPTDDSVDIEYILDVRGAADVTYSTANGGTEQRSNLTGGVVLRETFPAGAFVYLSAQTQFEFSFVTCIIKADGRVIAENESRGDFVIATCEGTAIPCPECDEAEEQASAWVPYGFRQFESSGVAFQITDDAAQCDKVTCVAINVISATDCPKGIYVDAIQLNAVGTQTGGDVAVTEPVEANTSIRAIVEWESNPENGSVDVINMACR